MKKYSALFIIISILIFSGLALTKDVQSIEQSQTAGIALTFDDHTIDNWYASKELFEKHGVKATFFISKMYTMNSEQIRKLKELQEYGHEIGCHSANHLNAKKFLENNYVSNYMEHEILPALSLMKDKGFAPKSFAYPFGSRTEESDIALLEKFSIIRGTARTNDKIRIKGLDKVFYRQNQKNNLIYGVGIDKVYGNTLKEIYEGIDRARDNNEILVFYAHLIGEPKDGDKYMISKELLEKIIIYAKERNLKFYTISEMGGAAR